MDQIFMDYLFKILNLPGAVYDLSDHRFLFQSKQQDTLFQLMLDWIKEPEKKEAFPYFAHLSTNIFFWHIRYEGKRYLFGPVGMENLGNAELRSFAYRYHLDVQKLGVARIPFEDYQGLMSFSNWGITGVRLSNRDIQKQDEKNEFDKEKTTYEIYKIKAETFHAPYELEEQILKEIEDGVCQLSDYEMLKKSEYPNTDFGRVALESDMKQAEYMAVASITLAARAAIRGGVQPRMAYAESDLLLQRLSVCTQIFQYQEITTIAMETFANMVRRTKMERKGVLVEQCKDYIAKHLYQKFTITQMSEEIFVSRTYLSAKFREQTGKSIQEYIMEERLNAAANLLKYSNESIAQISDYLHFSSPGRFSGRFKKVYGMTPHQFRETYKNVEFK